MTAAMNQQQLLAKLNALIDTGENEVIEFKEANDNFKTDDIGRYVSAMSNEANLRNLSEAWLVFGVRDKTLQVVGTDYRLVPDRLQSLMRQIADCTEPSMSFKAIHVLEHAEGRVVMMQIPAAPRGMPVTWKDHYYGRTGATSGLHINKLDEIRSQTSETDWTARVLPEATLNDLDEKATQLAREGFATRHDNRISKDEVMNWPLEIFLDKARLTTDGKLTRAAILLLGKFESDHLLSPHLGQITWSLVGQESAYEHFGVPFIVSSSVIYNRIRNIQMRILPGGSNLVSVEVAKYGKTIVMEALHNCIAHQDYTQNARIIVTEYPDRLEFESTGGFFEGTPNDYVSRHKTPSKYRNPYLARSMSLLNMIDNMGRGIYSMHIGQARRFFPMPDYDLTEEDSVKFTMHGKFISLAYSRLLIGRKDLLPQEIFALDRIQKKLPLTDDDMIANLRSKDLIEGRKPLFFLSRSVCEEMNALDEYNKNKGFDDELYKEMIVDYIQKNDSASRGDLEGLLLPHLSGVLTPARKQKKVDNLISKFRLMQIIENSGTKKTPLWVLCDRVTKFKNKRR